jgi:hypothetical protein
MFATKRFSQCQGTRVLFSTTCPSGNSPAKGRVGFELGGLEPMPLAGAEATRRVPSANPLWAVPVSAPTEADDSCVFTASAAVASAAAPVGAYGPRKVVDSIGWVTGPEMGILTIHCGLGSFAARPRITAISFAG